MNKVPNFLWGSFSNRVNLRAPIHFSKERYFRHLKSWFFIKDKPIHFYISSTIVIRLVKWNKANFPELKSTSHFCPSAQCLVGQIQVHKLTITEKWKEYALKPNMKFNKTWVYEADKLARTWQKPWIYQMLQFK